MINCGGVERTGFEGVGRVVGPWESVSHDDGGD
jgi:hypothetical protein